MRSAPIKLASGLSLFTVQSGSEQSEPVILLHGFPESHHTWRHQLVDLAEQWWVIAPDQRGFGKSSKPKLREDYAPNYLVNDIVDLADALQLDRFTLVGHDWGGAVAWAMALKHPERLKQLIIINGAHPYLFQKQLFTNLAQREASQYINDYRQVNFEQTVLDMGWDAFIDRCFDRLGDVALSDEQRQHYLSDWQKPGALTAMLNWYRATPLVVPTMSDNTPPPAFLNKPFPVIDVPTGIIWGLQDLALQVTLLDGIDHLVSNLVVHRIDGGHFLPWQKPRRVNALLRQFLLSEK